MNRFLVTVVSAFAVMLLFLGAVPTVAAQADTETAVHSGVVIATDADSLRLWTNEGELVFELNRDTSMPERVVGEGNLVVVRETEAGSLVAENVLLVDQEVWVEGIGSNELAIIGRVEPSVNGPSQLIIRTAERQELFVIDPKTFHQPLPEPGQQVALTYRVEDVNPPLYKATGLVILPGSFDDSPVKVTYSDIDHPAQHDTTPVVATMPAREPIAVPAVATKPAREPVVATMPASERYAATTPEPRPSTTSEPMDTLPSTAGRTPAVALLSLLLVATGLAVKLSS